MLRFMLQISVGECEGEGIGWEIMVMVMVGGELGVLGREGYS